MKKLLLLVGVAALAVVLQFFLSTSALVELGILSFAPTLGMLLFASLVAFLVSRVRKQPINSALAVYPALVILIFTAGAILYVRFAGTYATEEEKEGKGYVSVFTPKNKDASWYWAYKPNIKRQAINVAGNAYKYYLSTNNLGFRSPYDFSMQKKPGEVRIMTLGDGYTEGVGAPIDSTYPIFLERFLNYQLRLEGADSDKYVRVWNCGRRDSDPFYDYILYRDKLKQYKPDLVIVSVNTKNLFDDVIRGGFRRFKMDGTTEYNKPLVEKNEEIFRNCQLCRPFIDPTATYPYFMADDDAFVMANNMTPEYVNMFMQFNKEVIQNGGRLLVLFQMRGQDVASIHPQLTDIGQALEQNKVPVMSSGYCVETSIQQEYNDLINQRRQTQTGCNEACSNAIIKQVTTRYFWPQDGYYTSGGYALMAYCMVASRMDENSGFYILDLATNQ